MTARPLSFFFASASLDATPAYAFRPPVIAFSDLSSTKNINIPLNETQRQTNEAVTDKIKIPQQCTLLDDEGDLRFFTSITVGLSHTTNNRAFSSSPEFLSRIIDGHNCQESLCIPFEDRTSASPSLDSRSPSVGISEKSQRIITRLRAHVCRVLHLLVQEMLSACRTSIPRCPCSSLLVPTFGPLHHIPLLHPQYSLCTFPYSLLLSSLSSRENLCIIGNSTSVVHTPKQRLLKFEKLLSPQSCL